MRQLAKPAGGHRQPGGQQDGQHIGPPAADEGHFQPVEQDPRESVGEGHADEAGQQA